MDTKKKPATKPEISQPDKNPEIDPDRVPEQPVLPEEEPEINPGPEPDEPSPAEIPTT